MRILGAEKCESEVRRKPNPRCEMTMTRTRETNITLMTTLIREINSNNNKQIDTVNFYNHNVTSINRKYSAIVHEGLAQNIYITASEAI